jgi:hypothetical protein
MLDSLDPNSQRVVRKHFEENNIPLTAENLAKFAGSDAQRQVFIYDAVNTGMSQEAANELYDSIQRSIAVSPTPIDNEPRASDEELGEYAEDLRVKDVDAMQSSQLPTKVGETLGTPETPEGASPSFDEFTIQDQPKKEGEAWVDDFNYVTKPEDEPFPQDPVETITKDDVDWDQFYAANRRAVDPLAKPAPFELPEFDKPIRQYDGEGVGVEGDVVDTPTTTTESLTKAFDTSKPHVEDVIDPNTGATLTTAVQRPSEIPGATVVGPAPAHASRVGEETAREPKELFNKITNTPGLSRQEMMIGFSAADKLMNATKDKPANLTPQEKLVLGRVSLPSMGDGTPANLIDSKQLQKESVENKFIDAKTEEEFWKAYQEYDTAREQQAAKDNTEDKENMRDMMFAARARGVGAKKDYTEGLSAIDKKKFLDGIVKGFGQIVAGATGHMTGTDVGGRFKYDLTDYTPQEKNLTDVYNTAVKEVGDEVKMLQDNLIKMDKEAAGKKVDTLKDRLEMLIKFAGLTQTKSNMSTEAETKYAGFYQQMQDMMKYLLDVQKMIAYRDKPPPSTNISSTTTIDNVTKTGTDQTTQITPQQLESMKRLQTAFDDKFPGLLRIKESDLRTKEIQVLLNPHGLSAGRVIKRMEEMGIPLDRWDDFKQVDINRVFNNAVTDEFRDLSRRQQNTESNTVSTGVRTKAPGPGEPPAHKPPKSNVVEGEFIPPLRTPTPTPPTSTTKSKDGEESPPKIRLNRDSDGKVRIEEEITPAIGREWAPAANALYDGASVGGAITNGGATLKLYIVRSGKTETKEIPVKSPEAQRFIHSRNASID